MFYDMGFLASNDVLECSATDLIGEYVGQTGPKVIDKFNEALGRVLFIDEAYRLDEGPYAKEAIDEIVDCLTKERYKGKMLVVLAGYEAEINKLLHANPGLSSRFPEEIMFKHLTPKLCLQLLINKISKLDKLILDLDTQRENDLLAMEWLQKLSQLSGWGNGRDIENLAKRITSFVLKSRKPEHGKLRVLWSDILSQLEQFHAEREKRSKILPFDTISKNANQLLLYQQHHQSNTGAPMSQAFTSQTIAQPQTEISAENDVEETKQELQQSTRDFGVTDATWQQLQIDTAQNAREETAREARIHEALTEHRTFAARAQETAAEETAMAKQAAIDDEARRRLEAIRLKALQEKRKAEEAAARLEKLIEQQQCERDREHKAQQKLRQMGVCVAGFQWIKQRGGYRCAGGSHWVADAALGL